MYSYKENTLMLYCTCIFMYFLFLLLEIVITAINNLVDV